MGDLQPLIVMAMLAAAPGNMPTNGNYVEAIQHAQKAMMEDPDTKANLNAEGDGSLRLFTQYTGVNKNQLAYAAYMSPFVTHTVSTKPFKNLDVKLGDNLVMRPDFTYNFGPYPTSDCLLVVRKTF